MLVVSDEVDRVVMVTIGRQRVVVGAAKDSIGCTTTCDAYSGVEVGITCLTTVVVTTSVIDGVGVGACWGGKRGTT